jgi:hypothetical protein
MRRLSSKEEQILDICDKKMLGGIYGPKSDKEAEGCSIINRITPDIIEDGIL